jgi:uncharacterized protein (TIRG00374 family)
MAAEDDSQEDSPGHSRGGEDVLGAQSRTLRNSVISLAIFFVLVVVLLLAVPGLQEASERLTDASPPWVLAGVGMELLSCLGYVVLFALVFDRLGRSLSTRLSLSELAVNSVVSVSGLAGLALGAWVLRVKGFSAERIAERSVGIFMLSSAASVAAVVVIGIPMWLGLLPGSTNPLLTLLPAALALAAILATIALAAWAGRAARARARAAEEQGDAQPRRGRRSIALLALNGGVQDALRLIRRRDPRLLGAVAYWLFDALTLYAALAAFGHVASFWAVAMAYLVGMLANSVPIPGGFGAVEGGLVGMLDLFDVAPGSTVIAAVVVYRAISLWVPALIGSMAFLSLRRELGRPEPALNG